MSFAIRGRMAAGLFALLVGLATALAAFAAPLATVDTIVVKYRDDTLSPAAQALPDYEMYALAMQLRSGFAAAGRTRDGAFRFTLNPPLPIDEARVALNRVRMDAGILWAGIEPQATAAPRVPLKDMSAPGPGTDRIIVKFKDPSQTSATLAGLPLSQDQLDQLSAFVGQLLTFVRGTAQGSNVLALLQRLPDDQVQAITALLEQFPGVAYAEPDYIRTIKLQPTDPCYASASIAACNGGYQWDLFDPVGGIDMPAAWNLTTGSPSVRVGVVDTGALFNHPDLSGRFVGGYDMVTDCAVANDNQPSTCTWSGQQPAFNSRDSDASDPGDWVTSSESNPTFRQSRSPPYLWFQGCFVDSSSFHGSHVAGTIGAIPNNGIGIAGINWVSQIVPVRVLGKCGGYDSDISDGMVWAAGGNVPNLPVNPNPVRVMNLSLGGTSPCSQTEQSAINAALALNAVVVIAAGNESANASTSSPGNCNGVITVGATTRSGQRSFYSNYGATVEISAPGGSADGSDTNILSTINSGSTSPLSNGYIYQNYAGTSMATPHVTGVVSLLVSAKPSLTPAQVLATLQTTARAFPATGSTCPAPDGNGLISVRCNCTTALCGAGIVDAGAAVASVSGAPTATVVQSNANPANVGVTVTFTATVTGNAPTGTVGFTDNGSTIQNCGSVALSGGGNSPTAQCATNGLAAGNHTIVATYSGGSGNAPSISSNLAQAIKAIASVQVQSSMNPSGQGSTVTFTAQVTGFSPTGTVAFTDSSNGNATVGTCSAVAVTGSGNTRSAQCATSALAVGAHTIVATYSGDGLNTAGNNSVVQNVNAVAATATVLGTSGSPSTLGTSVVFTATVTGINPTGTVAFTDGANGINGCGSVALTGSGNSRPAACTTSALSAGSHAIKATYSGDPFNGSSFGSIQQSVLANTTTALQSSQNPVIIGNPFTLTASVTGVAPTGTVAFTDGGNPIAGCTAVPLAGSTNTRTAGCSPSGFGGGNHSIVATYSGDTANKSSFGNLTQTISAGNPTTTTVTGDPNPATTRLRVTFTATVTGTAPTGTVTFTDGATVLCANVALNASGNTGTATCSLFRLSGSGTHTITASYSGNATNLPSSGSVAEVVN